MRGGGRGGGGPMMIKTVVNLIQWGMTSAHGFLRSSGEGDCSVIVSSCVSPSMT